MTSPDEFTSRSPGGEDVYDRTMKDYAEPITARQLVDIVASLRNPRQRPA